MCSIAEIKNYAEKIGRVFEPERIVLFGSFAKERFTENSDVDLLVIMDHDGRGVEQAYRIRQAVSPTFPLDLIVRNPKEVSDRLKKGDYFLREILDEGVVVYERVS